MKFTVATFVALVAAAAAMPSSEQAPKISQKSLKKIEETQGKCGDANVNCCVKAEETEETQEYDGLAGILKNLLAPDTDAFCTQASSQGTLALNLLPNLIGGNSKP